MLATVRSGALIGLEAVEIQVEVDYNPRGITGFTIVGLPDAAVQESRERVRSAIRNRNLDFPTYHYLQVDALTNTPLNGNPCIVVLDADDLDVPTMQALVP